MIRRSFGRSLAGFTGAAVLGLVGVPAAYADEWCDVDPLVLVVTPGGSLQPIHVTLSALGTQHRATLRLAKIDWKAVPAPGGSEVTITVAVPPTETRTVFPTRTVTPTRTVFPVRAVASSKPYGTGVVVARSEGTAGQPMQLVYNVSVA